MKTCKFCDRPAPSNLQGYCQSCYRYFILENKTVHPLPEYGEITYTEEGDCICPFCGKAYRKLGGHFVQAHGLSSADAHKLAGWDRSAKATNVDYRNLMRRKLQTKCVTVNLIQKGKRTRYTLGSAGRPKEKVSQMTLNRLKHKGEKK